MNIGSINP